jgi:hypothetical protein
MVVGTWYFTGDSKKAAKNGSDKGKGKQVLQGLPCEESEEVDVCRFDYHASPPD